MVPISFSYHIHFKKMIRRSGRNIQPSPEEENTVRKQRTQKSTRTDNTHYERDKKRRQRERNNGGTPKKRGRKETVSGISFLSSMMKKK